VTGEVEEDRMAEGGGGQVSPGVDAEEEEEEEEGEDEQASPGVDVEEEE
jgi:hypothetical protein